MLCTCLQSIRVHAYHSHSQHREWGSPSGRIVVKILGANGKAAGTDHEGSLVQEHDRQKLLESIHRLREEEDFL